MSEEPTDKPGEGEGTPRAEDTAPPRPPRPEPKPRWEGRAKGPRQDGRPPRGPKGPRGGKGFHGGGRGPRRDDRGPRRDDRGPHRDDRGPRRDDRGPRRDDRGPRRDARGRGGDPRGKGRGDKRPRRSEPQTPEEAAHKVVAALRDLGRLLAAERGFGEHEDLGFDALDVAVRIPLARTAKGLIDDEGKALSSRIDDALATALRQTASFEQGAIHCFLCDGSDCNHSRPPEAASTFAGYAANGKPEWRSFTNLCIERGEERVDKLYAPTPEIIAITVTAAELADGMLPVFAAGGASYRLLGQVVAGLIPSHLGSRPGQVSERIALTFQLVETADGGRGSRLRLNILGVTPEQIADAAAFGDARGPAEALRRTIRETRHRIDGLARRARRSGGALELEDAAGGLLTKLRGDVERVFRPVRRRTKHAQERHEQGDRPTGHAMDDVANASTDQFYGDERRKTIVVLGSRGRAHIFSDDGKHVTSIRLKPGELERKTEREWWKPLGDAGVSALKQKLAGDD